MTTRFLTTRRSPEECFARIDQIVDGTLPVPGLSIAKPRETTQLLGRVRGNGFSGALVDAVPGVETGVARVMGGLFGFRMAVVSVGVRILQADRGSVIRASFHQPLGDAVLLGLLLGASLAFMRESALELTAALPIALGIYLLMPILRRKKYAQAEADVIARLRKALDAKPM